MKKYLKNLGTSASIIATVNTNIAMNWPGSGAITIVLDKKEYKDGGKAKIYCPLYGDEQKKEKNIIYDLNEHFTDFTNDGKTIDGNAKKYLITKIEGGGLTHNDDMTYTFTEQDKPLKIHLKSKKYIKIKYTDWQKLQYDDENKLIEEITKDITVFDLFNTLRYCFYDFDLGESNINGTRYDSKTKFIDIDDGKNVTITIDSSKIKDGFIRRVSLESACSVDFIKPDMLDNLNCNFNFRDLKFTLGDLKTKLNDLKCNEDGKYEDDGKQVITGPFKIQIDGDGNEIESTAGETDLSTANYIHLIVDKNSINPYFLQKEFKFDIEGGIDNYIISNETINKIQESLNKLTNTEEVTQDAIFEKLAELENVFL